MTPPCHGRRAAPPRRRPAPGVPLSRRRATRAPRPASARPIPRARVRPARRTAPVPAAPPAPPTTPAPRRPPAAEHRRPFVFFGGECPVIVADAARLAEAAAAADMGRRALLTWHQR